MDAKAIFQEACNRGRGDQAMVAAAFAARFRDVLASRIRDFVAKGVPATEAERFVADALGRLARCPFRDRLAEDPAFADFRAWLDVPDPPPPDIVAGFTRVLFNTFGPPAGVVPPTVPFLDFRRSFSRRDRILRLLGAAIGVTRALPAVARRSPREAFRLARDLAAAARSRLFDRDFYAWAYPDVTARRFASPLLHYCMFGWREGRRFSPACPALPPDAVPPRDNPLLLHARLFPGRQPTAATIRRLVRELCPERWAETVRGRLRAEAAPKPPLAVVVPVYNHPELLPPLVASLLENTPPDVLLLFVENGSEDKRVRHALLRLAETNPGRVQVECLDGNLGFAGACNHGIRAAGRRDVILLNNDTVVGPRWSDSLRLAAYADPRIGTATAVSNNSGLASVPERGRNEMPPGLSVATVARGWLQAPETVFDLHTGHGFCLYLKRAMLDDVGEFDAATFGKGYGEETDLCLRAFEKGWRHRITTRAFVWHLNAVSFGGLYKAFKVHVARHTLLARHPELDALEGEYIPRWGAFCPWLRILSDEIRTKPPRPRLLFASTGPDSLFDAIRPSFEPFTLVRLADGSAEVRDLSVHAARENGPEGADVERGAGTDDELVFWILEHGIEAIAAAESESISDALAARLALLHIPVIRNAELPPGSDPARAAARLGARVADAISNAPREIPDAIFAARRTRDLVLAPRVVPGAFDPAVFHSAPGLPGAVQGWIDPAAFDRMDLSDAREIVIDRFPLPVSDDARLLLLARLCGVSVRIAARTEDPCFWRVQGLPHARLLAAADTIEKPNRPVLDAEFMPEFPESAPPVPPEEVAARATAYRRAKAARDGAARMVVYTAIAGGYEPLSFPESPDPDVDYVYFAPCRSRKEGPWTHRPLEWTDEDPTRTARWHKLHGPDLFPDAEVVVWIDGNITLRAGVEMEIRRCLLAGANPLAIPKHFDRDNVYDEVESCILFGKDDPAILRAQVARYREAGLPERHPFAETCIVAFRPADPRARAVFATWWQELAAWSRRDQISFPYALWKNGEEFTPLFDRSIRDAADKVLFANHWRVRPAPPCAHARQFVLSRRRLDRPGFRHLDLPNGFVLSFHSDLRVRATLDRRHVLLGLAWSCDPAVSDPLAAAAACGTDEALESVLDDWSGRWVLLRDGRLRMDACGLLGVFFHGGDCSSSLALLGEHLGLRPRRPGLKHQFGGMDFYPGPLTPLPAVHRLLPGQGLDLASGVPFERPPEPPAPAFDSEAARVGAVLAAFDALLPRIAADHAGRVMLPLTAGYDSRTLAALLFHAGVRFETFTLDHLLIRNGDRDIPPRLARLAGAIHRFVPRTGRPDRTRYRAFDRHCAGMAVDEDRNFFAFRQYPEPAKPSQRVAVLRGGVWESVREYYRGKIPVLPTALDLDEFRKSFLIVRYRPDLQRSLSAWLNHCRVVSSSLDSVDRYYLEQRAGAWLSSVEQSLDIVPGMDSIQACNCRRILSLLRSFPREERISCAHQVSIIRAACPPLLEEPFQGDRSLAHGSPNRPPSTLRALLARKRRTLATYLRCLGLRGTIRLLLDERK